MHDGPLMITGTYRSGKALIAHMLNGIQGLEITSETLHFFRFYLGRYLPMSEGYPEIVAEAVTRLEQRWDVRVPGERIIKRLQNMSNVEMKDVYQAIMTETFCNGNEDMRWGEMTGLQWTNIPLFLQTFPNGQTIHVIRDPRDVLASFREYTYETPHRYLDAIFCCLHSMNWAATVGASLPKDRYLVIRHEDMVTNPEGTGRKACDFLQMQFDPSILDPSKFTDDAGKPWLVETPFEDVTTTITTVSVGRWRERLQPFELLLTESVLGELIPKFGYEPSDVKGSVEDLKKMWDCVHSTPLIQSRMNHWLETGEGVESFPSNPIVSDNWPEIISARSAGAA